MIDPSSDSSFASSDELTSDEEYFELIEVNKTRNEDYFSVTIPQYSDREFIEHFRVSRKVSNELCEGFSNSTYFHFHAGRNGKISAMEHILIFLWYAGHQTASFRDVGDRFNITISALFCVIRRVTYYLSNKSRDIIKWPSVDEQRVIEQHYAHKGFPGVIGSVDGTHIRIDKPENDPESYFNRKHYYSIQLQVVSDHRRQIRDVFVGFPGSVHDARIFAASPLNDTLAEKCHNNYILGDSAYPCLLNLLTPYKDNGHLTRRQVNYNAKLSMNRYVVEHCIGLLKQKFRQLFHIKLRKIPDLIHFIRSCCVLHNIALEDNFEYRIQDEENVVNEIYVPEGNGVNGNQLRDHVANNVLQI